MSNEITTNSSYSKNYQQRSTILPQISSSTDTDESCLFSLQFLHYCFFLLLLYLLLLCSITEKSLEIIYKRAVSHKTIESFNVLGDADDQSRKNIRLFTKFINAARFATS